MKLLLVSALPPPVGGIATWTNSILNYYKGNEKWEVVHINTAIKYRKITNENKFIRLIWGIRNTFGIIKRLVNYLNISSPDAIHLTSSGSAALFKDFIILFIAKKQKIPIIVHFHFGRIPAIRHKSGWEWLLLCKVIRMSNKVIVIDNVSFLTLLNEGFNNISNIPNPISEEVRTIFMNQLILSKRQEAKVLFVGNVLASKGIFELVDACILTPKVKELLIIGPYENYIKNELDKISKNKQEASWIKFLGSINNIEVLKYMSNSTVLVLPSYAEGFPIVVLEAMLMKCPVVATYVGAIPEILDIHTKNPCGICVSLKNTIELSNALLSIINDQENAEFMGNNGLNKVLKAYTFNIVSKKYEKVWTDALQDKTDYLINKPYAIES